MVNKVASNVMAVLSLSSTAIEAGKRGFKKASAGAQTAVAIKDIQNYTGDSRLNVSSEKHNAMKEMVRGTDIAVGIQGVKGAIGGFCKGMYEGVRDNIVSTGFAILTLASKKNNVLRTIGVIGCGVSTAWDFISNGTNLFTKKDIIEK